MTQYSTLKDRLVLVLGMHRSGTSCLAGSLRSCGLPFGDVNESAGFNKKGNQEHVPIVKLHDSFLASRGASWDSPPPLPAKWTSEERVVLENTLLALSKTGDASSPFGLKDPRTLLFFQNWKAYRPICVGTYRHPEAVMSSLVRRAKAWGQDLSRDQALSLWCTYNRALLQAYSDRPFPIIAYDQAVQTYNGQVKILAEYIGLEDVSPPTFRDNALTNFQEDGDIPKDAREIWAALEAVRFDRRG